MSRRGFALGLCALLLAACAGLLPRSIVLGEPELQAQLARRFPIERSLFDTFTLKLSDPLLSIDAAAGRLGTELTLQGSDLRNGRSLQGMLALKLYYDTDESREGVNALKEKRKPEFKKYAK